MGLLYIILSFLLNVHSAFEVKKFLNTLSWEIAKHTCNKDRSNLTFAVPLVDLCSMTVLDKLDLEREAWVGYFETYEYFHFIACVPLSEIETSVSEKFKLVKCDNRPGLCYSICGLRGYIGLLDDVCYCIVSRNFSTLEKESVNTSCEDPLHCEKNAMLCGNRKYNKVAVYKKVYISSKNDIRGNGSGCLVVTRGRKNEISVANCSDRFQHLCESYSGLNLYLEVSPTNDQWVYSFRDCQKTGKKPTTFIGDRTMFVFPTIDGSWWTSVVRDLVIRNYSESMTIKETPVHQGFLRNSAEGTKLEFIRAWINSRITSVACMSGKESTPEDNGAEKTISSEKQTSTMMSHSIHRTTKALVTYEQASTEQGTPSVKHAGTTIMSAAHEGTTTPLISEQSSTEQGTTSIKQTGTTIMSATPEGTTTPLTSGKESTPEDNGAEKTISSEKQTSTMMSHSTHQATKALVTYEQSSTEQGTTSIKQTGTTIMSATPEGTTTPLTSEQPSTEQESPTIEQAETTIMSAAPETITTPLEPVSTVILPVGLAALALITVVTLSCVCWRRREAKARNNEEASKQKATENVVPRNSETHQTYYEHVTELLNPLEENDQGNVSSEYSFTEYNAPLSAPTGNLYDTSNFNIGGGTYAVKFSANTLRQVVPANSYDHVRIKITDDGQYDHVELQDQTNSVIDNDTYDHCNVLASDNTYSDTCQE